MFEIGPLTIHFYALCIIAGVALAIWLGNRRFLASFPQGAGVVADVAIAVGTGLTVTIIEADVFSQPAAFTRTL